MYVSVENQLEVLDSSEQKNVRKNYGFDKLN